MSRLSRILGLGLLLATWIVRADPAAADSRCALTTVQAVDDAWQVVDGLRGHACLGGSACATESCLAVSALKEMAEGAKTEEQQLKLQLTAGELLRKLRGEQEKMLATGLAVPQLKRMYQRWHDKLFKESGPESAVQISRADTREWEAQNYLLFQGTDAQLNLEDALADCGTLPECQAKVDSAIAVYTNTQLVFRTLSVLLSKGMENFGKTIKTYDLRWSSFLTGSKAMYPWELLINDRFYEGTARGFAGPPSSQWLFLHPSIGVVYNPSEEDKMQEVVLVDLIGRYQWTWGGKELAEQTRMWGVSAAAGWAGEDPGYGIAVHAPRNWSGALLLDEDRDLMFVFSMDFGSYILDKKKEVDGLKKKFDELREKQP